MFARKGFHTSRVGDIAEEAGVAHGLLYHYFSSKDEVLETIFRENWASAPRADRTRSRSSDEPAREQLRHVAAILLARGGTQPDVVRVLVREIARSAEVQERIGELVKPIEAIRRIIERGQETGEFRADLDPALAAIVFYGGIDELLSGWVLGQLPDGDEEVAAAERTVIDVVCAASPRHSRPANSSANRAAPTLPPESTTPTRAAARRARRAARRRRPRRSARRRASAGRRGTPSRRRSRRRSTMTTSSTSCPVHRERQLARLGRLQPVGDRARHADPHALARRERPRGVVARLRLDADDADPGAQRLRRPSRSRRSGRRRRPARRAASRSGTSSSSSSAVGPLARHHERIVVRLHELERRAPPASRAPISSRFSVQRSYVTTSAP